VSATPDHRLPLTIVTGFLGSGKTTLIRRLLGDPRAVNAAVIVNEFGEVGIDHHLFRKTEERITLLRDGCACCARRDDLVVALKDLLRRVDAGEQPPLDRVILETTGLADPAPILHTLVADPVLSRRYRVDRIIATLDAVAGATNLDRYGEAVRQVAAADVVVLTKGDLAAADALKTLSDRVATLNPAATILTAERGHIDAGIVFNDDIAPAVPRSASRDHTSRAPALHAEPGGVTSLTMTFDEPLDWRMLGLWLTMLLHRHGERILRVKGLLDTGEEGPLLLEGVQHVVHAPRHLAAWPDADRRTRLVFILREIDPARVRQSLDAFRTLTE
jgi:G3E family GTPase